LKDIGRFAGPAHLANVRAIVRLRGKLPKPGEDRLRAHDLAASPAFLGGQLLALERQPPPLLGVQFDAGLAGRRQKNLLEDSDLLLQVRHLPRHPRVERVREHRDDELERPWEHQVGPILPRPPPQLQASDWPANHATIGDDGFLDITGSKRARTWPRSRRSCARISR
jgi:hypothetical protein